MTIQDTTSIVIPTLRTLLPHSPKMMSLFGEARYTEASLFATRKEHVQVVSYTILNQGDCSSFVL